MGCQSLFSTAERIYLLKRTDVASIFILLLWVLSPMGGQSAIRLLTKEPVIATTNATIRYLPIELQSETYLSGASAASTLWGSYVPLFSLSLLTKNTQNQPLDAFGNVKVPALDTSRMSLDDLDWQVVDYSQQIQYSSLLGIPITGIPAKDNATFDIASRYWDVACTQNSLLKNKTELTGEWSPNISEWKGTASYFQFSNEVRSLQGKIPLRFMTGNPNGWLASFANCTLEYILVDSSISCTSGTCRVTAMRAGNQSAGIPYDSVVPLINILYWLPQTFIYGSQGSLSMVSPLELWLIDPTSSLNQQPLDDSIFRNISELPTDVLASRLRVVINSFWQSSYASDYIEGYLPEDLDNFTTTHGNKASLYSFNSTEAHISQQPGEKYICQWVWATLLFGTSALLFLAACSTTILQAVILAPDILGYVSSSARDNQKVISSANGSFLSGLEWAYRFKDVKVMIGNMRAEGEEGQIAMALKTEDQPQRLSKGKIYI